MAEIMNTVIVTGAAGSLGSALSLELLRLGWNVVMLDVDRRGLEKAYDSIEPDCPGQAALHPMDLAGADPGMMADLLEAVSREFGGLDALVHCAARFVGLSPSEHIPPEEWLLQLQVNLNAAWLLSVSALPALREAKKGKLVFMLENMPRVESALWGAYGVSKHALRALVNQLADECRSGGVAVKGVNPGGMRSAIRTRVWHTDNPQEMPSPQPVARQISSYLSGAEQWPDVFVDLSQSKR